MVTLTHKEDRVLKAYLRGMDTTAIGKLCNIGTSTACSYLLNIMRKFGVDKREDLRPGLVYEVQKYNRCSR